MKELGGYKFNHVDCFWCMVSRLDEYIDSLNDDDIQNKQGVYVFFDWDDNPIRVGKASKCRNRILQYYTSHKNEYVFDEMEKDISFVSVLYTESPKERAYIEADIISKYNPKYNYTV